MKNGKCSAAASALMVVGVILALVMSTASLVISLENYDEITAVSSDLEAGVIGGGRVRD